MKAGRLHHTVVLQSQSNTKNAMGEFVETYSTIATRRASIEPVNGREYWQQSGEHSDVTTRIRIRRDSTLAALKPKDRCVDTTFSPQAVYDIESVIRPRERFQELVLMCVRRSGG
jgi:head-tail adaptor